MPIIIVLCGMFFTAPLWSWGNQDRQAPQEPLAAPTDAKAAPAQAAPPGELIRVHGRVRLVGSMPLPGLVISDVENHDWYLEQADRALVAPYEQRILTVEGRVEYQDLILANGEKIGVRGFLRDVRIIEIL
ncbi:MAG: hypothetical protein LBU17_11615 [Treponema sp.]|jgi:hypothetical protein|nr:hypothetical protein [Treponema sp.]